MRMHDNGVTNSDLANRISKLERTASCASDGVSAAKNKAAVFILSPASYCPGLCPTMERGHRHSLLRADDKGSQETVSQVQASKRLDMHIKFACINPTVGARHGQRLRCGCNEMIYSDPSATICKAKRYFPKSVSPVETQDFPASSYLLKYIESSQPDGGLGNGVNKDSNDWC